MKIHPLHTIQYLTEYMRQTGEYPDPTRFTGRTTAIALRAIATALLTPYVPVKLEDHHGTLTADRCLEDTCRLLIKAMSLQHFHVGRSHIQFGGTLCPGL